jgi:hypothetical protein
VTATGGVFFLGSVAVAGELGVFFLGLERVGLERVVMLIPPLAAVLRPPWLMTFLVPPVEAFFLFARLLLVDGISDERVVAN